MRYWLWIPHCLWNTNVCGFVACPQMYIPTNEYCLTESIMIHVHDISEILWDTQHRRTYHIFFCYWAISVLRLTSVFHLNGGELLSETETVAWNIHSYFKNYQNHLFDIVTKVMEKMSELWKLSLLTDRQIDGQWTHKFIYTLTKVIFKIWLEQYTSVIKYYLNDNYFFEPRDFSYLPAHCSDT